MRYTPLDLLGGSNVDDNVAWSREDTINYIPQKASSSGARTEHEFRDAPGLKPFVMGPTGAGPVRGSHDCEGKHFVVMGSKLYQITNNGVAIPLGTVPGTQRVNMAHNQIVGGNEVIITTGTPNGYVYNTVTQVFGRITDPGYPGGGSVDYIDTYLVSVEPYGRYWFWSDQANATSYNTLNRTEAEADPDSIVGLAVNSFEVVVFGQNTVEFFYNAGGINGSTFRSKKVMNNHGCAARDSIVKLDNSLFWLGVDGILYRLNGYQAMPISSTQFTQRIAGLNWAKAFAFAYEDQGHATYYITFPDGQTWGYDVTTGLTVRRESYGLNRWRLSTLTNVGRKWIGGDFQSGLLYEVDWNYPMEGEGTPLVRERVTGNVANNQNKIEVPLVELLFQTGTAEVEPVMFVEQPEPPTITGAAPDGTIGLTYAGYAYTVTGTAPLTVTLRPDGVIPPGITLNAAGVLSATVPTAVGSYPFTLRVTDGNGLYAELTDTVLITSVMLVAGVQSASSTPSAAFSGTASAWTPISDATLPITGPAAAYGDGRWVCVIKGDGWYSDDLITWTQSVSVPGTGGVVVSAGYGNGVFLVVGSSGILYRSTNNSVNYSAITDTAAGYHSIAYGNGLWIMGVGGSTNGPYRTSADDGLTWTQGSLVFPYQVSCALWNGEKWAICGGTSIPSDPGGIKTSVNGSSWSAGVVTPSRAWSVTYGNGIWVALCEGGQILYSADDWVTFSTSATTVSAVTRSTQVCFNGLSFVLCEDNLFSSGFTRTSVDGNTWTAPVTTAIADNMVIVSSYEYE